MEEGTTEEIFYKPQHPYTLGLMRSIPKMSDKENKERLIPIDGTPPDLLKPPAGCPFAPRCDHAMKICMTQMPEYTKSSDTHRAACWLLHPDAPKVDYTKGVGKNV